MRSNCEQTQDEGGKRVDANTIAMHPVLSTNNFLGNSNRGACIFVNTLR